MEYNISHNVSTPPQQNMEHTHNRHTLSTNFQVGSDLESKVTWKVEWGRKQTEGVKGGGKHAGRWAVRLDWGCVNLWTSKKNGRREGHESRTILTKHFHWKFLVEIFSKEFSKAVSWRKFVKGHSWKEVYKGRFFAFNLRTYLI